MTVTQILEAAKALTNHERKELVKLLIDTLDVPTQESEPKGHWGQSLLQLLNELEPVELIYPEIEDPVEWVKQIRQDQLQQPLS